MRFHSYRRDDFLSILMSAPWEGKMMASYFCDQKKVRIVYDTMGIAGVRIQKITR